MPNPKVFISHASEDKDRFVIDFATKLRKVGIDAWLDKWEMLPGDSLVNKIFEEGIKESNVFIVVISKHSISKPWVKEELSVAFVNKVIKKTKLIPVLIDDCEEQVPECLKATIWEKIVDTNNYDRELNRITNAILGKTDKPELGEMPIYAQKSILPIYGFSEIDSLILKTACEVAIKTGRNSINSTAFINKLEEYDIKEDCLNETLSVLVSECLIKSECNVCGGIIALFSITDFGLEGYAKTYIENYDTIFKNSVFYIINHNDITNENLSRGLNISNVLAIHIINTLENDGLLKTIKFIGGMKISDVSPKLKRIYP